MQKIVKLIEDPEIDLLQIPELVQIDWYQAQLDGEDQVWGWDLRRARQWLEKAELQLFETSFLEGFLPRDSPVNETYLENISLERLEEPVWLVLIADRPNNPEFHKHVDGILEPLVIDGTHRLIKRQRLKMPITKALVFNEEVEPRLRLSSAEVQRLLHDQAIINTWLPT